MSGRRGDRSRVQIPAARFSEIWGNFFGLRRFAKVAKLGSFGSSRGVRTGGHDQFVALFDQFVAFFVIFIGKGTGGCI